jgi:hypothetical protein
MFFGTGRATDPIYERVRNNVNLHESEGRAFIELIWLNSAPYLDADLAERAPSNGLIPTFWEMYLAYALKTYGINLVPRSRRVPKHKGPDLFAEMPEVWIEAVAATPGDGPDALKWGEPMTANRTPIDQFILRLRTAVEYKAAQLKKHIERGYIKAGQSSVIAVSGAMLPYRHGEGPVPFVVRAVLGVGNLVLDFDRATTKQVGQGVEYCDEVKKAHEASVRTDLFLDNRYSHVSAVIYSPSCWIHHPATPGADFMIIHNPQAASPLPDEWFPLGGEYWLDGSGLRHKRHAVNNWREVTPLA